VVDFDPACVRAGWDTLLRCGVPGIDIGRLVFSIMHGNGNVIFVVDEGLSGLSPSAIDGDLAKALAAPFDSPRIDGVAFVRVGDGTVRMTYFERDGTHSQMCGNALRCVTRYATEQGYLAQDADVVLTDDGPKWVSAAGGDIRVALGAGREFRRVADDRYFAFSGLPHLVLLLDDQADLAAVDVATDGAALRYDQALCLELQHPEGLHVDFMQRDGGGVRIRTYEVGVEAETLACGTGVAAAAYVAHRVWRLPFPVLVRVPGGDMQVDHSDQGLLISGDTAHLFGTIPDPVG